MLPQLPYVNVPPVPLVVHINTIQSGAPFGRRGTCRGWRDSYDTQSYMGNILMVSINVRSYNIPV